MDTENFIPWQLMYNGYHNKNLLFKKPLFNGTFESVFFFLLKDTYDFSYTLPSK